MPTAHPGASPARYVEKIASILGAKVGWVAAPSARVVAVEVAACRRGIGAGDEAHAAVRTSVVAAMPMARSIGRITSRSLPLEQAVHRGRACVRQRCRHS